MGTLDDYFHLPSINFSRRAIENKHTIDLCDNDCGAYIYKFQGQYYNAEVSKKDSLHKETCSVLDKTWMIAMSHNWYPDGTFLKPTQSLIEGIINIHKKELTVKALFEEIETLFNTAISLDGSLHARQVKNEEARVKWKKEKERKKAERTKRSANQQ